MEVRWCIPKDHDQKRIKEIGKKLNLPLSIVNILLNRDMYNVECIEQFLFPRLENLHDPFLLNGMESAIERMIKAIKNDEKIMIFGDYDVDGITAVALVYLVLKNLGLTVTYYIPNRLSEGYGLSIKGIQEAINRNASLIITVDCGITGHKEVECASSKRIDFIITDHHEPKSGIPEAVAVLNPKKEGSGYPFIDLAGVGVAWKFTIALYMKLGIDVSQLNKFLDLVALGSIADIVPLIGENRILAKFGLKRLAATENIGIKSLIQKVRIDDQKIESGQVVFMIAPRLNAIGRLGDASLGVRLLTTDCKEEAEKITDFLEKENKRRQLIDESTFADAMELIEKHVNLKEDRVIILAKEGWHQGVIGIVASKIVEKFYRPTIMISLDGEIGKGSARSIPGFHLYNALNTCKDLVIGFGGHKYAAGISIRKDMIEPLKFKINRVAKQSLSKEALIPRLDIEGKFSLTEINSEFLNIIKLFAPFGTQNPRPLIYADNLEIFGQPRISGKNLLRFKVRQNGVVFETLAPGMIELYDKLKEGMTNIDMVFSIEEFNYYGKEKSFLKLKDINFM